MSDSQKLSLDEDAVFFPVDASSPEFLHSEKEREAVERLLNGGPDAFYSYIGPQNPNCFLSPEEVSQISRWVQQYRFNPPPLEEENSIDYSSERKDFCSTYFPHHSDTPAPNLDLGWPEKPPKVLNTSVSIHSSPCVHGGPHIREIIRQHLQEAKQVIAIVTDRLTDNTIIADLQNAASRNVPVYIILNQRSIQDNFTLNRLKCPNIRVRALGGKTFCSRNGRMVVGELKENFILVDLETVIYGSYSLTWTDTHLHRQLITVLKGPDVAMFDMEYRILFAASIPAHHTWGNQVDIKTSMSYQHQDFSYLKYQNQLPVVYDNYSPVSPPTTHIMDWEAMGVVQRDYHLGTSPFDQHGETNIQEVVQNNNHAERSLIDRHARNEHHLGNKRRENETISPTSAEVGHSSPTYHNPDLVDQEKVKRVERTIDKALHKQLALEKNSCSQDKTPARFCEKTPDRTQTTERTSRRASFPDERSQERNRFDLNIDLPSRRSAVFGISRMESFTSPSDILKRIRQGTIRKDSRSTMSDRTQSMMDLSGRGMEINHYDRRPRVPRFQSNFEQKSLNSTFFMGKRSEDVRTSIHETPGTGMPRERTQSYLYVSNRDRRWSLAERDGKFE